MFRPEFDVRQPQCEYDGCFRTARYGPREGPMTFCQDHKRAGMYTSRNGKWLVATNDGNAFRSSDRREETGGRQSRVPALTYTNRDTSHLASPPHGREDVRGDARASGETCGAPGCSNQASYGAKRGLGEPVFCGDHKSPGMVQLSNRPCIYPGCYARARYGLEGARAVYCADHKKGPMMCLLVVDDDKEEGIEGSSTTIGTKDEDVGTQVAAASTAGLSHPCSEANSAACADGKIDGQTSEWGVHQAASKAARHGKAKGGALLKRQSKQASFPYTAMPSSDSSTPDCPPERGQLVAQAATLPSDAPGLSSLPGSVEASQGLDPPMICATGGAPSAEMRLLEQAREVARVAAKASGSGRRARAPSLKALRAAGLLDEEGTQVLTKAMSDEEVRKSKERREQWRANVAVGLRVGHVLEALTPNGSAEGDPSCTVAGAGGRGTWRRLTAEEILTHGGGNAFLRSAHQTPGLGGMGPNGRTDLGGGGAEGVHELAIAPNGAVVAHAKRKLSEVDRDVEDTVGNGVPSEGVNGSDPPGVEGSLKLLQEKEMVSQAGEGGHEGLSSQAKVRRQPENCRKKPRFGIDGVARCCKKHQGLTLN